jgi:pyridoxine/pyridoxamine 5'-phosphate oxidase
VSLTRKHAYEFLKSCRFGAIATIAQERGPQAALVNIAVTEDLEIVFQTLQTARKCLNLRHDPRVAIVTWKENETLQFEGIADEPDEYALKPLLDTYFEARPEARAQAGWPDLIYVRIKPRWIRLSFYSGTSWRVDDLKLV